MKFNGNRIQNILKDFNHQVRFEPVSHQAVQLGHFVSYHRISRDAPP